jgi:FixJ family two-component response regulator
MTARERALIAIVDDEVALREATESLIRSAGYPAKGFGSAEEFLRSESRKVIGCLILDIGLPGMSGLELQVHLAGGGNSIPIVFVTAQHDDDGAMRARAMSQGALAFLSKPFGDEDLIRAVRLAFAYGSVGEWEHH